MDSILPASLHGDEIERQLKAKAVAKALENKTPGRPHSEVRLEMLQMIEELEKEISELLAN
jgi:hypothetical protein